jgi:hypothetical protein
MYFPVKVALKTKPRPIERTTERDGRNEDVPLQAPGDPEPSTLLIFRRTTNLWPELADTVIQGCYQAFHLNLI